MEGVRVVVFLPPPSTVRVPSATAGGNAYSAHTSTSTYLLICGLPIVRKHKLENLFKVLLPSWRLLLLFQCFFFYFCGEKTVLRRYSQYSQPHLNSA